MCRTLWTAQRQWYHKQCEKITVFCEKQKTWFCHGCKERNAEKI